MDNNSLALLSAEDDLVAALLSMNVDDSPALDETDTQLVAPPQVVTEDIIFTEASSESHSNYNTTVATTTTHFSSLPEIEFDFGDDNFLIDPHQLSAVFDEDDGGEDNHYTWNKEDIVHKAFTSSTDDEESAYQSLLQRPLEESFPLDVELETEQLYHELEHMSLMRVIEESGENAEAQDLYEMDFFSQQDIPTGNDGLPFYLWCQPCEGEIRKEEPDQDHQGDTDDFEPLDPSLPLDAEDQPLDEMESEIVRQAQQRHSNDLKELYQSSQRHNAVVDPTRGPALHDSNELMNLDHSDPLLQEFEARSALEEYKRSWKAAQQWTKAFGFDLTPQAKHIHDANDLANPSNIRAPTKNVLKSCLGHKETIYGVSFSDDGKFIATASQDSLVNIWNTTTRKLLASLKGHDAAYECLRVTWASSSWADEVLDRDGRFSYILASAGADGMVKLWGCKDVHLGAAESGWKREFDLDHAALLGQSVPKASSDSFGQPEEEVDKPQVYALQFIDHWRVFTKELREDQCKHQIESTNDEEAGTSVKDNSENNSFLMTSSDDFIHLWEVVGNPFDKQLQFEDHKIRLLQDSKITLKEVMSLHFGSLDECSYGVTACNVTGQGLKLPPPPVRAQSANAVDAFGGERNPQNIVFVFDAEYCHASGLLGVALSDGSLRLVNGRGICISVLSLPGSQSYYLTSFCWDSSGTRLSTCVGTGQLITWSLDMSTHQSGNYNAVATCTAILEGGHQPGRPLFGSRFCGDDEALLISWGVDGKLCLWESCAQGNIYAPLAILKDDSSYPIYTVAIAKRNVAIGGGSDGGFIGIPLYLADLPDAGETTTMEKKGDCVQTFPPAPNKNASDVKE